MQKDLEYADKANNTETEPFNKFRIASISIVHRRSDHLKLSEEGKLSVNDRVFGAGWNLNDPFTVIQEITGVQYNCCSSVLVHQGVVNPLGDQMFYSFVIAQAMNVNSPVDTKTIR